MAADDPVTPEQDRCNRHDGRGWRCKRPVMDGKTLCEIHYVQGRLRSSKAKVPDSLKLQRPKSNSKAKKKVPDSSPAGSADENADNGGIRVKGRDHLNRRNKRKRSQPSDDAEADELAEKKTKNKVEEFLRVFVKREIEKTKTKKRKADQKGKVKKKARNVDSVEAEQSQEEVTRELPFGRMAISPPPAASSAAKSAPPAVKLGLKDSDVRLVNRRFRSKNIERPPISTVKAVPYAENVKGKDGGASAGGGRRKCHWCRKNANVSLSKCLSCKKRFFCSDCIKERSHDAQEVKTRCPVCRGTCDCKACLPSRLKYIQSQESLKKECKVTKYSSLHYLITLVLPILEKFNLEQSMELELEAKSKGSSLSEVEVQQVEVGVKEFNRCSFSILDLHRSCPNCSYYLCLSCCRESSASIGNLLCPSLDLGGCGSSHLAMRSVSPLNYTKELEANAKEAISSHDSPKILDASLHCSLCTSMAREGVKVRELLEASQRKHPGDNFLYCPSIDDDYEILLPHFQRHWRNSHPVIVRDIIVNASNVSWDPTDLFFTYLNMLLDGSENDREEINGSKCTDWFEVDFSSKESFTGSFMNADLHVRQQTLKLKAKLSSGLCQRSFRDHYAKIYDALPIQEYTNPWSGILNLAAKLVEVSHEPEISPSVYITCGDAEEIRRGELVSSLCYSSYDLVNILVYASDLQCSAEKINRIRTLIRMKHIKDTGGSIGHDLDNAVTRECSEITEDASQPDQTVEGTPLSKGVGASSSCLEDLPVITVRNSPTKAPGSESESDSSNMCSGTGESLEKPDDQLSHQDSETCNIEKGCSNERPSGSQWDIFRRQDTPKLVEYIRKHSDEFYGSSNKDVDPILVGDIFLDSAHKIKLKDEFKIEPWTFTQKLGEAVLIPAGCLYQVKNLKSCVNFTVGFVSPESASECIKLNEKLCNLPADNKAKSSRLEVEKMVLTKISKAIEESSFPVLADDPYDGPVYDSSAYTECKAFPERPLYNGGIIRNQARRSVTAHPKSYVEDVNLKPKNSFYTPAFMIHNLAQAIYTFSAWVTIKGNGKPSLIRAALQAENKAYNCIGTVMAKSGCWSFLKGGFLLNSPSNLSLLYFQTFGLEDAYISIASVSLQPFTEEEWRTNQQYQINKERKRFVTIHVSDVQGDRLQGASISINQISTEFPLGSAIADTILGNLAYQEWFQKRFNAAVFENELKWYATEREKGNLNYTRADRMMSFIKSSPKVTSLRGHNIFWEDPKYTPSWVLNLTGPDLKWAVEARIDGLMARYKDDFVHWDVSNELLHFDFYEESLGPNATLHFFEAAHKADPLATLFLNEFNVVETCSDAKSNVDAYVERVKELRNGSVWMDGIGLEGHFTVPNPPLIRGILDKLATLGLPIWLTEVDISNSLDKQTQAEFLEIVLREGYSHPAVKGMMMWTALHPKGCYQMCLTDENIQNLPAGDTVDRLLGEWQTGTVKGVSGQLGSFDFHGFLGDYVLVVEYGDRQANLTFSIDQGDETKHLNVQI
ncbi:hypothetical protein V2J09_019569 [Rumex salicifolius]